VSKAVFDAAVACGSVRARALALVLFSGCATTHRDFRAADVKPGQGVAIGRVHVRYNDKTFTNQCFICLNSANGPCQKLTEDGLVFQPLPTGTASLKRIACVDVSLQHHTIEHAAFVQPSGTVYFGDVTIEWANSGGLKATAMFGLVGALVDESSEDGQIQVTVDGDGASRVIGSFRAHIGDPKAVVYQSLAVRPDAPTPTRTSDPGSGL